jgi:hypothetical protein
LACRAIRNAYAFYIGTTVGSLRPAVYGGVEQREAVAVWPLISSSGRRLQPILSLGAERNSGRSMDGPGIGIGPINLMRQRRRFQTDCFYSMGRNPDVQGRRWTFEGNGRGVGARWGKEILVGNGIPADSQPPFGWQLLIQRADKGKELFNECRCAANRLTRSSL